MTYLQQGKEGQLILSIYVQPKASKNKVVGLHGEELKIAITAPPVDGKANKAVLIFLAKFLGLPKGSIILKSGQQSRHKKFFVRGILASDIQARIEQVS